MAKGRVAISKLIIGLIDGALAMVQAVGASVVVAADTIVQWP
jgi:hypothetical protein